MKDEALKRLSVLLDDRAASWMTSIEHLPLDQQVRYPNYAVAQTMTDIARQVRAALAACEDA